jgi:hypothetical protein
MDLKIDSETMRTVVAEAIVAKLDEQSRVDLIQKAVAKMLTPEQRGYSSSPTKSPLEEAFAGAVRQLTVDVTKEYIENHPEIKVQIRSVMVEGIEKLLKSRYEFRNAIASAVATTLEREFSRTDD